MTLGGYVGHSNKRQPTKTLMIRLTWNRARKMNRVEIDDPYISVPGKLGHNEYERAAMCPQITAAVRLVLFVALLLIQIAPLHAETRVTGTPDALEVETQGNSIDDILKILASQFGLRYRTEAALDRPVTGTYKGSLRQVAAALLRDFDYVAKTNSNTVEFIILRESQPSGTAPVPVVTRRRTD
jgi:hypothetical protein